MNSTSSLSPGEWYHIAVTLEELPIRSFNNVYLKIYINGELDAVTQTSGSMTYISDNRSNIIGARRNNSNTSAYGFIDAKFKHLRIWSEARSLEEIDDNKSKVVDAETSLLRYYKLTKARTRTSLIMAATKKMEH